MINSKFAVIIVAGGSGTRLGSEIPKQYLPLAGKMIIEHSIQTFLNLVDSKNIHVVIAESDENIFSPIAKKHEVSYSFGGKTRQESVLKGLQAIKGKNLENILIHDAARPFISTKLINNIFKKLEVSDAVIPAKKLTDTIKNILGDKIISTLNRDNHILVETPQAFNFDKILSLHEKYIGQNFTDDAALFETENYGVSYILNLDKNYKITTKEDYLRAKEELEIKNNLSMEYRIGNGFDVHQFEDGDGIILCGTKIPYNKKLKGHSDADCAWHALTDAILGAVGAGDIGELFPDTDSKWQGADSKIFLQKANLIAIEKGFEISNIDITIIAEAPKLKDFKLKMVDSTSEILNVSKCRVNIKATTTEKLGFFGRGEGLGAMATVSLKTA